MVYCIPKYHVDLEKDNELSMNYVISGYQYTIQSPFSRLAHEFVHIYNIIYPSELVNLRVFFFQISKSKANPEADQRPSAGISSGDNGPSTAWSPDFQGGAACSEGTSAGSL